jgi:hypothetical protein
LSEEGVEDEAEFVFTETGVEGGEAGVAAALDVVTVASVVGELGGVYAALDEAGDEAGGEAGVEEAAGGGLATWTGAEEPGPS